MVSKYSIARQTRPAKYVCIVSYRTKLPAAIVSYRTGSLSPAHNNTTHAAFVSKHSVPVYMMIA